MECDIYALRAATTVDSDEKSEVISSVKEMYETLLDYNNITEEEIVYAHFSQTKDVRSMNAAAALRASGYGKEVPLFCTQEADVVGSKEKCIRVLLLAKSHEKKRRMVYLKGAKDLRPDIRGLDT